MLFVECVGGMWNAKVVCSVGFTGTRGILGYRRTELTVVSGNGTELVEATSTGVEAVPNFPKFQVYTGIEFVPNLTGVFGWVLRSYVPILPEDFGRAFTEQIPLVHFGMYPTEHTLVEWGISRE